MEWLDILKGPLASSPLALVLGYACWVLWRKLESKDAQLKALNEKMVTQLLSLANRDD